MKKTPLVQDYMASKLLTLRPSTNIYDAIKFLIDNKISGAPVVDEDNRLLGLISEKDCLKLLTKGLDNDIPKINVADFMTVDVDTILAHMDIYFVAGIFIKNVYRRFPVIGKDGKLVGQISRRDVLRAVHENIKSDFLPGTEDEISEIKKEDVRNCKFPKDEVLSSNEDKSRRQIKLENATRLGNIEHYKVKIVFKDSEGDKLVNTTIWATTEKNISLKGGITIPINRIREVNIL
jgi:CBS domain-containing protein